MVPLPQDNVIINTTSTSNLTSDMPRLGKDINFTSYNQTVTGGISAAHSVFGSLTLSTTMTVNVAWSFHGRGTHTINMGGKPSGGGFGVSFQGFGGTYTLQSDIDSVNGAITHTAGTINLNGYTIRTNTSLYSASSVANALVGPGVIDQQRTAGGSGGVGSGTTLTGNVTFRFSGAFTSGTITWTLSSKTIYAIDWSSTSATATLLLSGAGTIQNLSVDCTTSRTLQFTSGQTVTLNNGITQTNSTSTGGVLSIASSTATSAATLSQASGNVTVTYASIRDSTATGGATFTAYKSTDVSNNTGWSFQNFPLTGSPSLAAITASGTSTVTVAATSDAILSALTAAGVGQVYVASTGSATLNAITASGAGQIYVAQAGSITLSDLLAAGTVQNLVLATGSPILGPILSDPSSIVLYTPIGSTVSYITFGREIDAFAARIVGQVGVNGTLNVTLEEFESLADELATITGQSNIGNFQSRFRSGVVVTATMTADIGDITTGG
jgi:hypothetical protein